MFCTGCGNRLPDDAKFCTVCGKRVDAQPQGNDVVDTAQPVSYYYSEQQPSAAQNPQMFQTGIQNEVPGNSVAAGDPQPDNGIPENKARENAYYGASEPVTAVKAGNGPQSFAPHADLRAESPVSVQPAAEAPGERENISAHETKKANSFKALSRAGEISVGGVFSTVSAKAGNVAGLIKNPGTVISNSIKQVGSSFGSFFMDPKRWIPVAAVAVLWLVLNILKAAGVDPLPTRIMSFLTFANGGMNGGVFGAIGGIIGKGVFAGAVVSLITLLTRKKSGGSRSFGDTLKGVFGVSLDTLWAYLLGAGVAIFLFFFISGGSTRMAFMGGAAAAFLSGRAALSNGFLKQFISSFTAKGKAALNSGRDVSSNITGFIRGLTAGFALGSLLGLININLILIILGGVLVVGGGVMLILQLTGAVKLGNGVQVQ